jgi:hypothetical protein
MSTSDSIAENQEGDDRDTVDPRTSRGEFLKWSGVALGGLYVGPKITSFAISKTGQAGSPAPSTSNHYSSSYSSSTTYTTTSSTTPSVLPETGGGAGQHGAPVKPSGHVDNQDWIPAAGAGAAALGWYIRKQARAQEQTEVKAHDTDQTD